METPPLKPLYWIGSAKADLRSFLKAVTTVIGAALHEAQLGGKHDDAKPLKGFGGASVLEILDDYGGDTYRAVYTVRFGGAVYVLHAFQKKSKRGIATSQRDVELIKSRLAAARRLHDQLFPNREKA
ncbi:type II toxin-antitoxin system RelE/ParE family toxin [Longimicrobium sp.]|jgi:phage-related protein|uniref:type II toxin-antitoxin system RelE/ParE family toxin n=1 Tax=Longimicrobium sp. TaxID=2029185 RepID=UPI002ED9C814